MNFTFPSALRRRTRVKGAVAVAAVVAASLLLAGCSSGSPSNSGGDAPKKLTFWLSVSAAQQKGYDQLAKQYKKKTGISIDIVNVPYSGYQTKLHDAAQANALPDVARVPGLDSIWANKLVDLSKVADNKSNHIVARDVIKTSSGKAVAIPSDVTSAGLFINKSLFDKAGVSYPKSAADTWTWTELISKLDQVRKATGAKYDLTYDASPSRLKALIYEFGGKFMTLKGNSVVSDSTTEKAMNYFVGLNDDTTMPKSVWTSGADPSALFESGQVVAYFSGVWQVPSFATDITKFEWASVPTPAQPVQASSVGFGGIMVGFDNNSSEATAAQSFLNWLYEPTQYKTLVQANGMLPVESGLDLKYPFTSSTALSAFALYNDELSIYAPISFDQSFTALALKGETLTNDPTVTEIGKVINGQQSTKQALANIVSSYNTQLFGK